MAKNASIKNHKAGDTFEYTFFRDANRPEEETNSGGGLIVIEVDGIGANFQTLECRLSKMDTFGILAGLAEVLDITPDEIMFVASYVRSKSNGGDLASNPPKSLADLLGKKNHEDGMDALADLLASDIMRMLGIDVPTKNE